jgi:hypothetical protein
MRTRLLLPLTLAAAAAGCRTASDGTEQAAFQVPQRDLTLQQAEAPQVEVASPVELARAPVQQARTQRQHRARPAAESNEGASAATPAPATVAAPASIAAAEPAAAPDPYALPPGKTVTVIPASSGPSSDPGWTDRGPPDERRGTTIYTGGRGGDCGGRHPGRGQRPDGFRGLY